MGQVVEITNAGKSTPRNVKRNVPPMRRKNADVRTREHLVPSEVADLVASAGKLGRNRNRDRCIILTMYRHGLRVSELLSLRWSQIDFKQATVHVNRLKRGTPSTQPIMGDELRLLRKVKKTCDSAYVFISERGTPLTRSSIAAIVRRAGIEAKIGLKLHPHMLRHSTGYYLANKGTDTRTIQAYLGHRSIQHTVRYTELAPGRFDKLWS